MVLSVTHRRFPGIPLADLEDAYSRLVSEQALARPFGSAGEVVAWVLEAMRNDAKDILRSARVRTNSQPPDETEPATGGADGFAVPEDAAIAGELRGLLREFLAELSDDDRRIAYLHLDPDWRWSHKQISKQLGIPLRDVRLTVGRVSRRLDRFGRLYSDPSALCQRRREDVIAFQPTGQASLALRMHLRRCPSCGVELRRSQQQLRSAILPLLPAGAVPAASLGLIARINRAAATHPATQRVNDTIARTRKLIPGGAAGGGGAAITAKILAAGTGLTVGAALQVVRGTDRPTPHHQHRLARVAAVTTAPAATTDTVAVTRTARTPTIQPLQAPTVTTTATTATTTTVTSTTPAVVPIPNATAAAVRTSTSTATARTASATSTLNPYPVAPAAPDTTATSHHSSPGSGGSTSSPLPTAASLAP